MMMFGGVPIVIASPPSIDPSANGMRARNARIYSALADWRATGNISYSAPTLLMNSGSTVTVANKGVSGE